MSGLRFKDMADFLEKVPNARNMIDPSELPPEEAPTEEQAQRVIVVQSTLRQSWMNATVLLLVILALVGSFWVGYVSAVKDITETGGWYGKVLP